MPVFRLRFWALTSLLLLLLVPAAALACDTGSEAPSSAKAKKR
ncbi:MULTISPECIES: hypothetical protein [unclassified Cyanobium]|nr:MULTISPECIES: hypothetical protein [unclassified Cyanobium]